MNDEDDDATIDWPLPEVVADDPIAEIERVERVEFLNRLIGGEKPLHAGMAMGWSPHRINRVTAEPDMVELMAICDDYEIESVEMALVRAAKAGNFSAQQWFLMNRAPHRWQDTRKIVHTHTGHVSNEVVLSVKAAALELIREHGPAALRPGGAIDVDVIDDPA